MFRVKPLLPGLAGLGLVMALIGGATAAQDGAQALPPVAGKDVAAAASATLPPVGATTIEGRSVSGGAMITPQDLELANGVHPGAEAMKPAPVTPPQ